MPDLKKKILYLVTQAEWGGAQRYVFDLATHLAEEFEITVATGKIERSGTLLNRLRTTDYGLQTHTFKHLIRNIHPWHDLLAVFEIAQFLRQNHFDIIHLNSSKAGVIGALAAWLFNHKSKIINLKSKIIYTAHGWVYLEPLPFWRRWIYLWMEKIAARLRHATIVLSEKEKEIALKFGTAGTESIFIIQNGIDLSKMEFLGKEEAKNHLNILTFKHLNNCILIGTIANLYKTKGLEYLIEAANIINKEQGTKNNWIFIIMGEGPERKNLELRIKNYELGDKIILTGMIPNAYQYLKVFDIFVLPSVKEGFPYTILEAMAAGLPIIATDVGAIPEIIENQKTGVLVPPADAPSLTQAILDIINDPEKAKLFANNAREAVKNFTTEKMTKRTRQIYLNRLMPE